MVAFLVSWIGFCIAIAIWAAQRGRSAFGWFVFAFALSPLLAAVFLAVLPNLAAGERQAAADAVPVSPQTHVRCPQCAEPVLRQARACKHCGARLVPKGLP